MPRLSKELMKRIAIYKANNPDLTYAEIADDFGVAEHQVRYAIEKHAENIELGRNTKKGIQKQAALTAVDIEPLDILAKQLKLCLSELECNDSLAVSTRIDLLLKAARIRRYLQALDFERHLKRADAELIANIIRRFKPNATDDEVIKIYFEELAKWKKDEK